MHEDYNAEVNNYLFHWKQLVQARRDSAFFAGLKPIAIGWKAADPAEFDKRFVVLRAHSDQVHMGWVNKRWIATFSLREPLAAGITTIKLMQIRPGTQDRPGLDHLDFLAPEGLTAAILKTEEPNLDITDEENGEHCRWISIWFAGSEAKLRSDTVWDVCIAEMQEAKQASLVGVMRNGQQ